MLLEGDGAKGGSKVAIMVDLHGGTPHPSGGAAAGGGGAAAQVEYPIKVPNSACKAVLSKGYGFHIADCTDKIAGNFRHLSFFLSCACSQSGTLDAPTFR